MIKIMQYVVNVTLVVFVFFLMIRRPPRSTRTDTLCPYTTLFRSNIKGTLNICQAALDNGVRRVVHTSTSEVYGTAQYVRSEEHTSELQSLMRISYAVFCLKKKNCYHLYITCYAFISSILHLVLFTIFLH